jgi:hypothetical protein
MGSLRLENDGSCSHMSFREVLRALGELEFAGMYGQAVTNPSGEILR